MNKQEETYFAALSKDRSEIADVLERRAVRGYKDSVVEKYSDQAHFIYELLQNADDACATRARFILEENRLIFAHNEISHTSMLRFCQYLYDDISQMFSLKQGRI